MSDLQRRELFDALSVSLGSAPASTLMELLPAVGWGDVARTSDLVAIRGEMSELRGEMSELRGEMSELRAELRGEMSELRAELRGEMSELRAELRSLVPKLFAANVAAMIGLAGLVLAAAGLT